MPTDDKRKDARQTIADLIVSYGSATVEELIQGHARDFSKGGMFVRTDKPLAPGALVSFEVRLANEEVVLNGVGRVVWKRDQPQGDKPVGMGVRFIDVDEESQAVIDRLLAAKTGPESEFDAPRPLAASSSRKQTMMGIAPAMTAPPAAPGVPPAVPPAAPTKPAYEERVGTRLGLAPPVAPAGLVLADQSEKSAGSRAPSTSDIDEGWLTEEAKSGKSKAVEAKPPEKPPEAAAVAQLKTVRMAEPAPVAASPAPRSEPPKAEPSRTTSEPPAASSRTASTIPPAARPSSRPSAVEAVDPPGGSSAGLRILLLVVMLACVGVYYFREPLRQRGLLPSFLSPPEPPPTSSAPAASESASGAPPASVAPVDSAAPPDASADEAGGDSDASIALAVGLDAGHADAGRDAGPVDAGRDGSHGIHPTPSASASGKPRPPKKKPADAGPIDGN